MKRKVMAWVAREEGVTLIELVIVIAILGVIAAVAVPMVADSLSNAKTQTDTQNKAIVQDAVDRYRLEHDGNNPDEDDLKGSYLRTVPDRNGNACVKADTEVQLGDWCITASGEVK